MTCTQPRNRNLCACSCPQAARLFRDSLNLGPTGEGKGTSLDKRHTMFAYMLDDIDTYAKVPEEYQSPAVVPYKSQVSMRLWCAVLRPQHLCMMVWDVIGIVPHVGMRAHDAADPSALASACAARHHREAARLRGAQRSELHGSAARPTAASSSDRGMQYSLSPRGAQAGRAADCDGGHAAALPPCGC